VLGICYGHQLLAHALGGEAGDHPQGAEVGTVTVTLDEAAATDALLRGLPAQFPAHAVHWQSALRLPEGAVRLAGNDHEPVHAFRAGAHAWGVQFHPEFDADVMRGYIDQLAGDLVRAGTNPAALREHVVPTDAAAGLLGRFARIVEAHHGV
jgi:GMP synthase (glutamine-hydrolysing)